MRNMFFRLESGAIIDLQKLQLIEKCRIWFQYDEAGYHGLEISDNDYEKIQKILNPEWTAVETKITKLEKEGHK